MKSSILIFTTLLTLLASAHAIAEGDGRHDRGGHFSMMNKSSPERILQRLERVIELDDAQRQVLANVVASAQPEFDALKQHSREHAATLRALDVDDPDYTVKLQNLAATAGELATQSVLLHGRLHADIEAELTDAQQSALENARESHRERRHERHRRERQPSQSGSN